MTEAATEETDDLPIPEPQTDLSPEEQREITLSNMRLIRERLDAVGPIGVNEASLSILTRSKKGDLRADIYFGAPECEDLRPFSDLIMPLHIYLDTLYSLCAVHEQTLERTETIRDLIADIEEGEIDFEFFVEQLKGLLEDAP